MSNLIGALSHLLPNQNTAVSGSPLGNASDVNGDGFLSALKEKMGECPSNLQFSKHATARLSDRKINLSEKDIERISRATDKAAEKGARDALMMLGNLNLIVSVNNRTVVTAMQAGEAGDAVYTNIDTAVVVGDEAV